MPDTVLYYAVGPVHPRNLRLIASGLPAWDFKMVYEPDAHWMTDAALGAIPFEKIPLGKGADPVAVDPRTVKAVVFSTIQPRRAPVALLKWVMQHGLTSIAIEESNQIALNDGVVNNYLLPINHLLVASPHEREGFIAAGVAADRVDVTGWPFLERAADPTKAEARTALGLDPDRPLAALTLTGFNDPSGETPAVRHRLLSLASQGLPQEFQLAIKPHPIEKMATLMPFVEKSAPQAAVIDGSVPIGDLLAATDVLLNRGVSQVAIEALDRKIPVVVLSAGRETPFHSLAPEVVADSAAEVGEAVGRVCGGTGAKALYRDFFAEHMPYASAEALTRTCRRLEQIVVGGEANRTTAADWLELALYQAWKIGRKEALATLSSPQCEKEAELSGALGRLVGFGATRADLEALRDWCRGRHAEHVLQCLWIAQLARGRGEPDSGDCEWMGAFPPRINVNLFLDHCEHWMFTLLCAGLRDELIDFGGRLRKEHGHIPEAGAILARVERAGKGLWGCVEYRLRRVLKGAYRAYRKV